MTEKMYRRRKAVAKATSFALAFGVPASTIATFFASPSATLASSPPPPPPPPPASPAPVVVNGNQWFDWNTDMNPPVVTGYQNSPRLTNANAAAVNAFLTGLGSGVIHAVKVQAPLSTSTANLIFNNPNYNVSYVFGDIETGLNSPTDLTNLVNQVRWVNGLSNGIHQTSGTTSKSTLAYVGGGGFSTATADGTEPENYQSNGEKEKRSHHYHYNEYMTTGANMSQETLFPGDYSYRNYASGNSTATSQSPPNIRTGLFVLPLWREGHASDGIIKNGLSGIHGHVPYLSNFGNYANAGLDNDRILDPNGNARFTPGQSMAAVGTYPFVPASKTANQMLSDRDFATLVAHIRLRGADSYMTLVSGIIGVSDSQMQAQAKEGWTQPNIAARMGAPDKRLLIGNEQIYGSNADANSDISVVNGGTASMQNVEQTGAIFSGVYSLTQGKLDILLSNMDDAGKTIRLPSTIGGYALNTKDFTVSGGSHLLIEYSLGGSGKSKAWSSYITNVPFTDLDLTTGRNRPGVPEPGMISLMGVAAMYGMTRRRRERNEVL